MKNSMKKEDLLREICEWYNYELTIKPNGAVEYYYNEDYKDSHTDINSALIEWAETLMSSDLEAKERGEATLYDRQLEFIGEITKGIDECKQALELNSELKTHIEMCIGSLNSLNVSERGVEISWVSEEDKHFIDSRYENTRVCTHALINLTLEELLTEAIVEGKQLVADCIDEEYANEYLIGLNYVSNYYYERFKKSSCTLVSCESCKKEVEVLDVYNVQECPNCKTGILPDTHKSHVKVEKIHKVEMVNNLDDVYDFQMYFDFENSKEVNEFLISTNTAWHIVYCEVDVVNNVFNLDSSRVGISWHHEDSDSYNFTSEQICNIRENVSTYIKENKLGILRDRYVTLLEKVCEEYGCFLQISKNGSVVLEDFVDAELDNVKDALIYFYEDFLKGDWANEDELDLIIGLIQDNAFEIVERWRNDGLYQMEVASQLGDEYEQTSTESLEFWCKFFMKTYSKYGEGKIDVGWIEKDVKSMQRYLNRYTSNESIGKSMIECVKNEEMYLNIKWEKFAQEAYEAMANKLIAKLDLYLNFIDCLKEYEVCYDETYDLIRCALDCEIDKIDLYWFDDYLNKYRVRKSICRMKESLVEVGLCHENCNDNHCEFLSIPLNNAGDIKIYEDEDSYRVTYPGSNSGVIIEDEGDVIDFISDKLLEKDESHQLINANSSKNKDLNRFVVSYDFGIDVNYSNGKYIVTTSEPVLLVTEEECNLEPVNTFVFIEEKGSYVLEVIEAMSGKTISKDDVCAFIGFEAQKLYDMCTSLCKNCVESYIKIGNKKYEVNTVIDLIKLKVSEDIPFADIDYEFNGENKNLLNIIMNQNKGMTLNEIQKSVNNCLMFCDNNIELFEGIVKIKPNITCELFYSEAMLIGKDKEVIAKEYMEKVLKIDSTVLNYTDCKKYFESEVEYNLINGYIVVEL